MSAASTPACPLPPARIFQLWDSLSQSGLSYSAFILAFAAAVLAEAAKLSTHGETSQ